jgi:hypothetical protein
MKLISSALTWLLEALSHGGWIKIEEHDMSDNKFSKPTEVTDAQMAFGGGELIPFGDWQSSDFMPGRQDIPEEFLSHNGTKWNKLFNDWFYKGLRPGTKFRPNKDIDPEIALRHLNTITSSWTPKHEHKEAAVSYLMSLWFKDVVDIDGKSILK